MSEPLIQLMDISKKYDDTIVLDEMNLSIRENEFVTPLGPSGCGKSTFGNVLCGLIKPSLGHIIYEGQPLHYPFRGRARREIQVLFQHPENSFNPRLTIYDSLKEIYKLYDI